MNYEAIVIGASAGGSEALAALFRNLPSNFKLPIIVVLHISEDANSIADFFSPLSSMNIKESEDKEEIKKGVVYFAPPGYHLSIENNYSFSLSLEERVNFSRPSIDILFETAAEVYKDNLIGIVLTGANKDGAEGLKMISDIGGKCIVQNPKEAYIDIMPKAAIKLNPKSSIWNLNEIKDFLSKIGGEHGE
jgi:two-component system chemotaxis response regulator CheB